MSKLFEKSTRKKLRFNTAQGVLSTEDLWDCSLTALNTLAIFLNKLVKEDEEEDFLKEVPKALTTTKLEFNVVLHILEIKKAEKLARTTAKENKENKDKLLAALARKQDDKIDNMSEEEIQKVVAAFAELPSKIDTIKRFEWGTNNSPERHAAGFTHCFMVSFDSEEGREAYLPHPAHRAFVEMLGPVLDAPRVLDFWAQN